MKMPNTDFNLPANVQECSLAELELLADNVRTFLLDNISQTGGHIGANLGTIELTIALHHVFKSPEEPLLFDTGHQGYTHKLLTGRAKLFPSLNQYGGMNRFLTPSESEHDLIEASHAGTAISIGLGMALARKSQGDVRPVVAVVGDSAMAEGSSFEALNHAVAEETPLILVVNDNGYAISPGFGALHNVLSGPINRARDFFESFGMRYFGPVDGHDIASLVEALQASREEGAMAVVHAKTIKGNGWKPSDNHPFRLHFSFPFDPVTGAPTSTSLAPKTYADVVGTEVETAMSLDDRIVCITPSTLYATGLTDVFNRFPGRCFDPGMEEQHALSLTVGFALEGFIPIIAYQSTFMQRAFDQLLHDVCFTNRPTLILSLRSGFSGYDNPTHHGIYDISYLRPLPNLTILYPKDGPELSKMIQSSLSNLQGPVMIMMPYGPLDDFGITSDGDVYSPQLVKHGKDIVILAVGNKFGVAQEVAESLGAGLINLRQIKPLPENQLVEMIQSYRYVVTLEEAVLDGGVGSAISSIFTDYSLPIDLLRIGLPCKFIQPGSNQELCHQYGLDAKGVCKKIHQRWPDL